MKLRILTGSVQAAFLLDGRFFFINDGVIFDVDNRADLAWYLHGFDRTYKLGEGYLFAQRIMDKSSPQVAKLDTKQFMDLPPAVSANDTLYNYDGRFFTHAFGSGGERHESCYDQVKGVNVDLVGIGAVRSLQAHSIISETNTDIVSLSWTGEALWRYERPVEISRFVMWCFDWKADLLAQVSEKTLARINRVNGDVVWTLDLTQKISGVYYRSDKLYVACGSVMQSIDVQAGKIDSYFTCDFPEKSATCLYFDGTLLYVTNQTTNRMYVHLPSGEWVSEYAFPDWPHLSWKPTFIDSNGVNYLSLSRGNDMAMSGVQGGILSWTAEEALAGKALEVESLPEIEIEKIPVEKRSESYRIDMPFTSIHDVLRLGALFVRRTAALDGKQTWDNSATRNRKFNGEMLLLMDSAMAKEYSAHLDMLVQRCNNFCKMMDITGKGNHPINVRWESK